MECDSVFFSYKNQNMSRKTFPIHTVASLREEEV